MMKSAYERVGGIFWIPRMLEKIRLQDRNELAEDYIPYLGNGFDGRCTRFLRIDYQELTARTLEGGSDEEILEWMFSTGRRPSEDEVLMWNDFISKRGWRDSDGNPDEFQSYKDQYGLGQRDDILTYFDFYEVDEGRNA